jgi:hypothetical protein
MILYIHGFKSTGNARKADELKEYFKNCHPERSEGSNKIISPTLDISPEKSIAQLENIILENENVFLVGSSLGGFYAMILSAKHNLPAVLINPAVKADEALSTQLGQHENYDTGEKFEWTLEHINQLKNLKELYLNKLNPKNLFLLLAEDDELLDSKETAGLYKDSAKIMIVKNAGHQFSKFKESLPAIEKFYLKRS